MGLSTIIQRDHLAVGLVMIFASGCASASGIDRKTAITIADSVCAEAWKPSSGDHPNWWRAAPQFWQAKLEGDHWAVSWAPNKLDPTLTINVPKNGQRPDTEECLMRLND
jgi:hypothetical protein